MMEDIAEQQDVAKEISDAISNPVAFGKCRIEKKNRFGCSFTYKREFLSKTGNDIDEDELEKELEELEQEELDKELLGVSGPATELPEVPTGELKDKTKVKKKGKERFLVGIVTFLLSCEISLFFFVL